MRRRATLAGVAGRALSRPIAGNRISNAFTDREALTRLLPDFDRAKRKIQFESFLFGGPDGEKIADAAIRAHERGVDVQVLLDGMGQVSDHHVLAHKLEAAGIDVRTYSKSALKRFYAVEHSKLVVIDDAIAWAGGVNFDQEINRDMMTRIEGPAVPRFQRTFHEGWRRAGGTVLPVKVHNVRKGDVTIQVAQTSAVEHTSRQQVLGELARMKAGDRVDMWMMDFGDHQVIDAVLAASDRGVEVRALLDLTPPFERPGLLGRIQNAILSGFPDLDAIKRLKTRNIDVRSYVAPPDLTKLHAKVWILTRKAGTPAQARRVIGGSVNAIRSAYDFNHELGFVMSGKGVGQDVETEFERDFEQHSRHIAPLSIWQSLKAELIRAITRFLL